jgi:hypothetical protein
MSTLMLIAALFFVVAASAQSAGLPVRMGPVGLVFPIPGGPLSAEQIEELTSTLPDGTSNTETLLSQVYRDSAGRTRVEWRIQNSERDSAGIVYLIDPVARFMAMLLVDAKIANYFVAPHSGSGPFQVGLPAVGRVPPGNWQKKEEGLGKRVIEGVEVEGGRSVLTSDYQPPLTVLYETWASQSLGLKLAVDASGPDWKHTAKLQHVVRREPDPMLFVIPPDYAIQN